MIGRLTISMVLVLMSMPAMAATLRGKVNALELPASGTTITLRAGDLTMTREIDSKRAFVFENVPPGKYVLYADAIGYKTSRVPIEVGDVEIKLSIAMFEKQQKFDTVAGPAGRPWTDGNEFFMLQSDASKLPTGH